MIAILGGGISGLSCAYYLKKAKIPFVLLEASDRVGGVIQTKKVDAYRLELGPNSTFLDEGLEEMLGSLNLKPLVASPSSKQRFIYKHGKVKALPSSPPGLLFSDFFSWKTKLKILKELKAKPQKCEDSETVSSFFLRHFNQEVLDYAVSPFVAGIYAAHPERLTIQACFPKLAKIEEEYGSLLKGMSKNKTERRKIISFEEGMEDLPKALADFSKENIKLNQAVISLIKKDGEWLLETSSDAYEVSTVINCLPPSVSAKLLKSIDSDFSDLCKSIEMPSLAVVHTIFNKKDVPSIVNGFGLLIPEKENKDISGVIWNSSLFSNRCDEDEFLFTSFVGGQGREAKLDFNDDQLLQNVNNGLKDMLGISLEVSPTFEHLHRYQQSIPQYNETITKIKNKIPSLESKGIYTATNWVGEISVVGSINTAMKISEKIISLPL